MRLLLVKTSSIGDVLDSFPALSDAARLVPGIKIDWLIEEDFALLPRRHPKVDRVLTVRFRHWRKRPLRGLFGGSLRLFLEELRAEPYDLIVDAQSLWKSAVMGRMANGRLHGYDFGSERERLCPLIYRDRHPVPVEKHAVERIRALFAEAIGYPEPKTPPEFGFPKAVPAQEPYLILLHGAGWYSKRWPIPHWQSLARIAAAEGLETRLPGHSAEDRARAAAIAAESPAIPVHTATLNAAWDLIAAAHGVVTSDTGLGHLAGALGVPTVALYGPNSLGRSKTLGANQAHLESGMDCAPCLRRSCPLRDDPRAPGKCMEAFDPETVWNLLKQAMKGYDSTGAA
ncbi:MAG: lipopolysaccharide heptosyltransferase I [Rhodospirillales bacterium]|nr:lipopolysaccharide heptosyltransferase I [Rhodospirillales bacterium]